jgi:hypothetical protein
MFSTSEMRLGTRYQHELTLTFPMRLGTTGAAIQMRWPVPAQFPVQQLCERLSWPSVTAIVVVRG